MRVILLVGPKGSGKTTLGRMLEARTGAHFLDIEAIALDLVAEGGGTIDEAYARRLFEEVLSELQRLGDSGCPAAVLETTAASSSSPWLLGELRARYDLRLVRVWADAETCEERIRTRDPSRQVDVPMEAVRSLHRRSEAVSLPWEMELRNVELLDASAAVELLAGLVEKVP